MGLTGTRNGRNIVEIILIGKRGPEEWKGPSGNHVEWDMGARGMEGTWWKSF